MLTAGMNVAQYFLVFIIYSFIGWLCEVVYCSIPAKHFINRGFLHGPLCPVYGFGGLTVMTLLSPWSDTWIRLFFASMLLTTILEYITSWLMETLFSTKWWDYSHYKFNIRGRVCLLNSVLFGVLGMLLSHFVHPLVVTLILQLSIKTADYIATGIAVLMFTDLMMTIRGLVNFNEQMAKLKEFSESFKERYENEKWFQKLNQRNLFAEIKERAKIDKSQFSERMLARMEQLASKQYPIDRLINAFPTMSSRKYGNQLEMIKQRISNATAEKKQEIASRKAANKIRKEARKAFSDK